MYRYFRPPMFFSGGTTIAAACYCHSIHSKTEDSH